MKLRLTASFLLLIATFALAAPVLAHGELVQSSPAANASLAVAPAQVELTFNEPLEPSFSTVKVLDSAGARVDSGDARVDDSDRTRLIVSLRALPTGVYTVSWRVLSAADGHVTEGAFPFAVGSGEAAVLSPAAPSGTLARISLGEVVSRWLTYLAAAALAGGALFMLAVWQPIARTFTLESAAADFQQTRLAHGLAGLALMSALLGSVIGLLTKAGQAAGVEWAWPWEAVTAGTLLDTRYGALWLFRLFVLLIVMAVIFDQPQGRPHWVTVGASLGWPLTLSLGSHAASEPQAFLPVLADWVHLAGASVWVGGLMYFLAGLWSLRLLPAPQRTQVTARLIPRFSALALTAVGVLTVTGLYSALLRVGTWTNLTDTLYGQVLLAKLLIALPMLALGAVNLLSTTPRLKLSAEQPEGNPTLVQRFQRLVSAEVTLGAALLLSVGLLTSVPPAQAASSAVGFTASAVADEVTLTLNINPGRVGVNTFTLLVMANGQPVTNAREVQLRFTPRAGSLAPSQTQLAAQGDGRYRLTGAFLSLSDIWQVQAVVRRDGQFDAYANFDVPVGVAASAATTSGAHPVSWPRAVSSLVLLTAAAFLVAVHAWRHTPEQLVRYGVIPGVLLAVSSIFVAFRPDPAAAGLPVNPIPPTAASIAVGQRLYEANCAACHGLSGQGDGPVGLTLNPRPANLVAHTAPGGHPDGQLYVWITDGFSPNPVMPKWRERLTDDERWHLVNYIRRFGQTAPPTSGPAAPTRRP